MNPLFTVSSLFARLTADAVNYANLEKENDCWVKEPIPVEVIRKQMDAIEIKKEDFQSLTREEALALGFSPWTDKVDPEEFDGRGPEVLLIPNYLYRLIPAGLDLWVISGKRAVYETYTDLDHDQRFCALAYGLIIPEKADHG